MNEKTLEMLSAYLDGQLPPAEQAQVEALLRKDPAARAELDSMREFAGMIEQAAPPVVTAPPDLRARILDRIKAEGAGPGQGGQDSGAAPKFTLKPYLTAGVVMLGLVGAMVYLDSRRGANTVPRPSSQAMDMQTSGSPSAQPAALLGEDSPLRPASAGDIQSAPGFAASTAVGLPPAGRVYTFGQGEVRTTGSVPAASSFGPSGDTDVSALARSGAESVSLESLAGWDTQRVNMLFKMQSRSVPDRSVDVLSLARRYNLNPGLLAAAAMDFQDRSVTELAMQMRSSLNATADRTPRQRLIRIIADLGGQPAWVEAWEGYLR